MYSSLFFQQLIFLRHVNPKRALLFSISLHNLVITMDSPGRSVLHYLENTWMENHICTPDHEKFRTFLNLYYKIMLCVNYLQQHHQDVRIVYYLLFLFHVKLANYYIACLFCSTEIQKSKKYQPLRVSNWLFYFLCGHQG